MTDQPQPPCALLSALDEEARTHPLERKLLVAGSFGEGRELLHALALRRGGWTAFEVTTPGRLAVELAGPELAVGGIDLLDDFARHALVDRAADRVFDEGNWPRLDELAEGVGFREAVRQAVDALRLSAIGVARLRGASLPDREKHSFLTGVLRAYEELLERERCTDHAGVLRIAFEGVRSGTALLDDARVLLLPGLSLRGLTGRLLVALRERGARVVAADPVVGMESDSGHLWEAGEALARFSFLHEPDSAEDAGPDSSIELFAAASVGDELREVLRRVMEAGLQWDEVEIVARNPAVYGSALHALSERLEIPVSYAVGLPIERTRAGQAAAAYLGWIESGFPADTIRGLLHSGDVAPPEDQPWVSSAALARRLRALRIGWRRERYRPAIESALENLDAETEPRADEPAEDAARRRERRRRELEVLGATLLPVLDATPSVSPPTGPEESRVSPAELAKGLAAFLQRVPTGTGAERIALERLTEVVDRVRETLTRTTRFSGAMAVLRRHLEIRVPASRQDQPAPWEASGGHLHLSDLEHGGLTGRRVTFVVGLQAEGGEPAQDPLLLDADRRVLAPADLPTSADRGRDRRFRTAALLARLRGRVVLSYPAWDPSQARVLTPDPIVLRAFRLKEGRPHASFRDLYEALGAPACPVPGRGAALDARDAWMDALHDEGRFLRGENLVRQAFPGLDAGIRAREARRQRPATAHDGLVQPRPLRVDPRRAPDLTASAAQLEDLGACPKRYLYGRILRLRPPEDPEREPDRWLDPRIRGVVLHGVFERTLRRARQDGIEPDDRAFPLLALDTLEDELEPIRRSVPAPGLRVVRREEAELEADIRAFVELVRARGAPWTELELRFGRDEPLEVELPGGRLPIRGAVDRVDRVPSGLRVVDYKTGGTSQFAADTGVFHGGRRLQHVVYAAAVEQLTGEAVEGVEYHFPTGRGVNEVRRFSRRELEGGLALVDTLLDAASRGRFLPTDDEADCRFCDFRDICRVRDEGRGVRSPPAAWAAEQIDALEEYADLRRARRWEDE